LPSAFEVYVGTSRGLSYGAWWDGSRIVYESFGPDYAGWVQESVSPSQAQWRRFWRKLEEIGVWGWKERYEPGERFEPKAVVREGVHWSFTLAHEGREATSSGDDAGPGAVDLDESPAFESFLEAVARLLGDRSFA
jgi:hypothetical protein